MKYIGKYTNGVSPAGLDIIAEFYDFYARLLPLYPADMSIGTAHFLGKLALGKSGSDPLLN